MRQVAKEKMCRNKKPYATEAQAIRAAIGSSRTFGKPMLPYRCPLCHKYHLTSHVRD